MYIGDTVTQSGNDGSTIGVAEFTVQVGAECDPLLSPPPGYHHLHSPIHARQGGAAKAIDIAIQARTLAALRLWKQDLKT